MCAVMVKRYRRQLIWKRGKRRIFFDVFYYIESIIYRLMLPDRSLKTYFFLGRKWKAWEVGNCCTVCCIMLFGEIDLINFNFNATQCYAARKCFWKVFFCFENIHRDHQISVFFPVFSLWQTYQNCRNCYQLIMC